MTVTPQEGDQLGATRGIAKSGTLLVLGIGLVLLVGWFAYQPYIPPIWLHDLASDISLRAAVDPDAPGPEDMRQATPHDPAVSPYICVAKVSHITWDHLYVVTSSQDLENHPALSQATWPHHDLDDMAAELKRDKRYQLLVMVKDNTVVDAELFYTFWGNLDAISQPEGFNREDAIFTAASKDGVYVVSPAADVPADACRQDEEPKG